METSSWGSLNFWEFIRNLEIVRSFSQLRRFIRNLHEYKTAIIIKIYSLCQNSQL